MSFGISPPPPLVTSNDDERVSPQKSPSSLLGREEWVEIIEPRSKTKIYANLDSGICAKSPPEGVTVLTIEDFEDYWWELYDKKTEKYYYYNPEQQKTVWTKPASNSSSENGSNIGGKVGKQRVLVIPVSKLQTFRKLSPVSEQRSCPQVNKCDASTQTIASNLVNAGTQTIGEDELSEKLNGIIIRPNSAELSPKLRSSPPKSPSQPTQVNSRIKNRIAEFQNAFKSQQAHNHPTSQISDLSDKSRAPFLRSATINSVNDVKKSFRDNVAAAVKPKSLENTKKHARIDQHLDQTKPSQIGLVNKSHFTSFDSAQNRHDSSTNHDATQNYFSSPPPPPPPISYQRFESQSNKQQRYRRSVNLRDGISLSSSFRPDDPPQTSTITSTFKKPPQTRHPLPSNNSNNQAPGTAVTAAKQLQQNTPGNDGKNDFSQLQQQSASQPVVTNNLSHYLVREAQAMGIALISDDELDDDDQDSEEECPNDDDEDTDLRDDLSSIRDLSNNFPTDVGEDSSEGGGRSFSDQESPNAQRDSLRQSKDKKYMLTGNVGHDHKLHQLTKEPVAPKSPLFCETTSSFKYDKNELIDDQKDPAACMSQQLDHRKLVENFKKTRQTSALGFNDSLSRSYRLEANNAVQRLKTVADTYFNSAAGNIAPGADIFQDKDVYKINEKYLRNLSTLSTLPRPVRPKPPQVPQDVSLDVDADYDVVEENCGYRSESDRVTALEQSAERLDTSKGSSTSKTSGEILGANENSSPVTSYFDRNKSTRGSTFSVESFARENLTRHPKKGGLLFNRKVKWSRMISWTKNSIKQPMISSVSSDLCAESIASFKLIQQFMGDRKITLSKRYRQLLAQSGLTEQEISSLSNRKSLVRSGSLSTSNTANSSTTNVSGGNSNKNSSSTSVVPSSGSHNIPDRLRDELAFELSVKGCAKTSLRDEIYVQLARQLTDNPSSDSTVWGLVLMAILLNYFSPSNKFAPFLLSFLEMHSHQMARDVCLPRLEKRLRQNWLSYCRKPADGREISIVRLSITKWPQYCGVFGESLDRIMSLQACSPYLKTLRLPWILTTLGEKLLEAGAEETEGVFRCAADHDILAQLRLEIDCVDFRKITEARQLKSLLTNVDDPHVIAGLLKLFFRQLLEPVFPARMYDACLLSCQDAAMACRLFDERLPNLNKDVVAYLISLLQLLSEPNKVLNTKMDTANLSMVWAPNLLRAPDKVSEMNCPDSRSGSKWSISNSATVVGGDEQQHAQLSHSQSMIFEQTRQEMQFIKLLIEKLDTSFIKDVL